MTYRNITKEDVDAAEPLEFGGQRQGASTVADTSTKRQRGVAIQLAYRGVLVTFNYAAEEGLPINEMEQSIDTLLKRDGWAAPAAATNGNGTTPKGKPKAVYADPVYDDNGDPCCPTHHKPLKYGNYGMYCSAKARGDEPANDKGYCALKFKE